MNAHLTISNLTKHYGEAVALDKVTFGVNRGELKVLLGPSGSGKSTVLKTVAGLISPTVGRVLLKNKDITDIPIHERSIGLMMQGYSLFPHLTAYENVAFPLRTPIHRCDSSEMRRRVSEMFELTGMVGLEDRRPAELSGGEQQRIALARALVFNPEVLLLDEPLGALDREIRERMQDEIRRIQRQLGMTVVYVTHDQTEAMKVADAIVILDRGRVVQAGSATDLYESPRNEFVARFLGGANILRGTVVSNLGGVLRVDAGEFQLRVPSVDGFVPDALVELMVRPERIQLGAPESGSNHLPATVVDSTYLGSSLQIILALRDGTLWRCQVGPGKPRPAAGVETHLHWRIEDTHVLPAQVLNKTSPVEASK